MGCEVSSPVSTTPGCSGFSRCENHSHGSSCGWTHQNPHTTPCSSSRCTPSLSLPCTSSQRHGLFRLPLRLRRSVIAVDFPVRLCLIRIFLNQPSSSYTRFLCGLFGRNTTSLLQPSLSSFRHCLDPPCSWRVRNCYQHVDYTSSSALVVRHHSMSIHRILHDHGAYPPACTTSGCRSACSLTHLHGFLRP